MKKMILPLMLVLLCAACQKVLDVDEPASRRVVVNGVPSAGQRAFVNVAHTRFFLDTTYDHPVQDADITLRVNGIRYRPDSVSHCNYFFPYTLRPDDRLRLDIDADGHHFRAETYVPAAPAVSHLAVTPFHSPTFNFVRVNFDLQDRPDTAEIYTLNVQQRDSGMRYNEWTRQIDTVDTTYTTFFLLRSAEAITASDVCPYVPLAGELYSNLMFLDNHIDGQLFPVDLYILQLTDTNERAPFKHEYTVSVGSVTPERFKYLISVARQSSMTSFFAEQGQAYTNIVADDSIGLGVFAGGTVRKFAFSDDTLAAPAAN